MQANPALKDEKEDERRTIIFIATSNLKKTTDTFDTQTPLLPHEQILFQLLTTLHLANKYLVM
jgi:hypothetical protein